MSDQVVVVEYFQPCKSLECMGTPGLVTVVRIIGYQFLGEIQSRWVLLVCNLIITDVP